MQAPPEALQRGRTERRRPERAELGRENTRSWELIRARVMRRLGADRTEGALCRPSDEQCARSFSESEASAVRHTTAPTTPTT